MLLAIRKLKSKDTTRCYTLSLAEKGTNREDEEQNVSNNIRKESLSLCPLPPEEEKNNLRWQAVRPPGGTTGQLHTQKCALRSSGSLMSYTIQKHFSGNILQKWFPKVQFSASAICHCGDWEIYSYFVDGEISPTSHPLCPLEKYVYYNYMPQI